ncbi:MAG: hypothetical protein WBO93_04465, partial [Gammaproteobacteria bacterium]
MSEYQYYEFIAIDEPLTPKQIAELRACSSRANITPTSGARLPICISWRHPLSKRETGRQLY